MAQKYKLQIQAQKYKLQIQVTFGGGGGGPMKGREWGKTPRIPSYAPPSPKFLFSEHPCISLLVSPSVPPPPLRPALHHFNCHALILHHHTLTVAIGFKGVFRLSHYSYYTYCTSLIFVLSQKPLLKGFQIRNLIVVAFWNHSHIKIATFSISW